MCYGMGLRCDAVLFHFTQLIPCEISLPLAHKSGHNEDRCFEIIFLQNRIGIRIVVLIPVIKGDQHGTIGQCSPPREEVIEFIGGNRMITMIDEIFHLPIEIRRLNRERDKHRVDHVIVEYKHLYIVLCRRRGRRCCLLMRMSHNQDDTEENKKGGKK